MSATRLTGQRCRCTACGEHFRKSSTFTTHRVGACGKTITDPGTRRCLTVAEMGAKGWRKRPDGFWVGAPRPDGPWNQTHRGETQAIVSDPSTHAPNPSAAEIAVCVTEEGG